MFMRLLPKPAFTLRNVEKFKHLRRKANSFIEDLTTKFQCKFINADEITCSQKALFTEHRHLAEYGFERMWVSISDAVQRFDKAEEEALSILDKKFKNVETQMSQQAYLTKHNQAHPNPQQIYANHYQQQHYQQKYQQGHQSDKYHYYNY